MATAIVNLLLLVSIFAAEYLVPLVGQGLVTLLFAACCITMLGLVMTWGIAKRPAARFTALLIVIGHGLLLAVVALVVTCDGNRQSRILGMLSGTAVFVLGVWTLSALFIWGWLGVFDKAVFGREDQLRLDHARATSDEPTVDSTRG